MPKIVTPLADVRCRKAKAAAKPYKLSDGGGLYLEIMPSGAKKWRFKYQRPGLNDADAKETRLTLGDYPAVTIVKAREYRTKAKSLLDAGIDPADALDVLFPPPEPEPDTGPTFEAIAIEFLTLREDGWSEGYHSRISNTLKNNGYPLFGKKAIEKVTGLDVLKAAKKIEARGARDMAERFLSAAGMVLDYAVGTGRAPGNVARRLGKFLGERRPVQHFPHVDEASIPELLTRINAYHGRPETRLAMQIMIRTFPRTAELRGGQWPEVSWDDALWSIPAARMKGTRMQKLHGAAHVIPLSRQVMEYLRELHALTGRYPLMFPGLRRPARVPMSEATINKALKIMGFDGEQTGHGFRGLAATIMVERSGVDRKVIDLQLSHKKSDGETEVWKAYDHAVMLDERRRLMQWWSDYLDSCRKPVE